MRAIGVASGLGCSVVTSLLVLIVGGVFLDDAAGTAPLFTLLGVALGLVVAGWQLYRLVAQLGTGGGSKRPAAGGRPGPPGTGSSPAGRERRQVKGARPRRRRDG